MDREFSLLEGSPKFKGMWRGGSWSGWNSPSRSLLR